MGALSLLISILVLILAVPVSVFALQILCSFWGRPLTNNIDLQPDQIRPRLTVLIPAHNESVGILPTLDALFPQLDPGDRVLVVADNCSDDTASVARQAGADVVVRDHSSLRGKSYALDFGVHQLVQNPPEVVVIVDADCIVEAGSLKRLASTCIASGRPVQALYLMQSMESASLKQRIAEFAWVVKNWVRPLGFAVLGLPCQLMGTGMAFRWQDVSTAELASGHLAEDMKLGVDLALKGRAPLFCPAARVFSTFPASETGTTSQRTRWEHGHLAVICREVPVMIVRALRSSNFPLVAMAFDLLIAPLALLFLLVIASVVMTAGLWLALGMITPFVLASLTAAILGVSVLLAWFGFGRSIVSLRDLSMALVYVAWKIPIYVKFIWGKQVEWVRTRRDS